MSTRTFREHRVREKQKQDRDLANLTCIVQTNGWKLSEKTKRMQFNDTEGEQGMGSILNYREGKGFEKYINASLSAAQNLDFP